MTDPLDTVTIVIRSVYERTEQLCRERMCNQGVPVESIFLIHEKPFSQAMKVAYQIGVDQGRTWTYCIDADVLLRDGSIREILKAADRETEDVFGMSGKLLDKVLGRKRSVGNHLFRSSMLERMIESIAPFEDESIRPETAVKSEMKKKGFRWKKTDLYLGLHDYEQHYHDLARKAFVHARKHVEHLSELIDFCYQQAKTDSDYRAVLIGLSAGIRTAGDIKINYPDFEALFRKTDEELGLKGVRDEDFQIRTDSDIRRVMREGTGRYEPGPKFLNKYEKLYRSMFRKRTYSDILGDLKRRLLQDLKRK